MEGKEITRKDTVKLSRAMQGACTCLRGFTNVGRGCWDRAGGVFQAGRKALAIGGAVPEPPACCRKGQT
jgi:hypothetical protein